MIFQIFYILHATYAKFWSSRILSPQTPVAFICKKLNLYLPSTSKISLPILWNKKHSRFFYVADYWLCTEGPCQVQHDTTTAS